MRPAGEAAFARRREDRTGIYTHEQRAPARSTPEQRAAFEAHPEAWAWFQAKAPTYRRQATWWVISAKRPETRERRLAKLIEDSAAGRTIAPLTPPAKLGHRDRAGEVRLAGARVVQREAALDVLGPGGERDGRGQQQRQLERDLDRVGRRQRPLQPPDAAGHRPHAVRDRARLPEHARRQP